MRVPRMSAISRGVWCAGAAVLLFAQTASAQNAAFRLGSPYNGVPAVFAGQPATPLDHIVIYDLPATGPYAAVAETPDGFIDLIATVSGGGSVPAAGYGVILTVSSGGAGLRFDPDDVVGSMSNMGAVKNPSLTQNANFIEPTGAVFGDPNVPGMIAGDQSVGIAAIYTPQNQDTPVSNNHGLTSIPVDVDAGLTSLPTRTKTYMVNFAVDDEFTGFINTAGTILTNSATFPHLGATVHIRESRRGDMDGNGAVNGFDISGFVSALTSVSGYQAANPWLRVQYISDFDNSGAVNGFDISGLVSALIAGSPDPSGPSAVPEPSTFVAAAMGLFGLVLYAIRRRKAASR
jgi:hypothetical protein